MKKSFLLVCTILLSTSVFAKALQSTSFHCSNPPSKQWGEYYAISASTQDFKTLEIYSFGVVEGSTQAEEEEPVNTVEEFKAPINLKEKATSSQWKNATPFDLSTKELGKAVLYLNVNEFSASQGSTIGRLKIDNKDIRLACNYDKNL